MGFRGKQEVSKMEKKKNKEAEKKQASKKRHIFYNPFNFADVALPVSWGE